MVVVTGAALVGHGEAGASMCHCLDFVKDGGGKVGAGDCRRSGGVDQEFVAADTIRAGDVTGGSRPETGGRADVEPVKPVVRAPQVVEDSTHLLCFGFVLSGEVFGVHDQRAPPPIRRVPAPPITPSRAPRSAARAASSTRTGRVRPVSGPRGERAEITVSALSVDSASVSSFSTSDWT